MSGSHEDGYAVDKSAVSHADHTRLIRELNDRCRARMDFASVFITLGVQGLGEDTVGLALSIVRAFDTFDAGNDPYHEHDFGAFELTGQQAFWKIDYYDTELNGGSPDPADPAVTARVMTIMLASEY